MAMDETRIFEYAEVIRWSYTSEGLSACEFCLKPSHQYIGETGCFLHIRVDGLNPARGIGAMAGSGGESGRIGR
jgi:hypothetical protein